MSAVDLFYWIHQRKWLQELIGSQARQIFELNRQLDMERLQYSRNLRDLIVRFRIVLETPEHDVRDVLDAAISDLDDEVARAEEHVIT